MTRITPTFEYEVALWEQGYRCIVGVDEVGRGPLAGPVVAGAAVLYSPEVDHSWLPDVRDSKMLTAKQRERLAPLIRAEAFAVGVGVVSPRMIDDIGIAPACRLAMMRAIAALPCTPDFIIVDGRDRLSNATLPQKTIIDGDALTYTIAAASVVAKVYRDALMVRLDSYYPGWGFAQHKGYSCTAHFDAIRRLGPSPVHRMCFSPFRVQEEPAVQGVLL